MRKTDGGIASTKMVNVFWCKKKVIYLKIISHSTPLILSHVLIYMKYIEVYFCNIPLIYYTPLDAIRLTNLFFFLSFFYFLRIFS